MADEYKEVRDTSYQDGAETVHRREVSSHSADSSLSRVQQIVYTIVGFLSALLAIRFVLSLLGANRANAFADLIYTLTSPFVAPFRGLFGVNAALGTARFEIETLAAIAIYMLIGWGIVRILALGKHNPQAL